MQPSDNRPPQRGSGRVVGILAVIGLLGIGCAAAGVLVVASAGTIRLAVHENEPGGVHLVLPPIPVQLVSLGAALVPEKARHRMAEKIAPYRPAIEAGVSALERSPDGPLVEIDGPGTHVRIVKHGRNLLIDVRDDTNDVHLEFPIHAIPRVLDQLAPRRFEHPSQTEV